MCRRKKQTYFEWYELDVNVVLILIVLILINDKLSTNKTEYVVKFQYYSLTCIQNIMSAYEYRNNNSLLISDFYRQ